MVLTYFRERLQDAALLAMLRVEYPGAIYHVMNRGDRREPIFRDDEDRERFVATLGEACMKTGWTVHAYCLMSNHFHQKVSVWIAQRLCMGARGHLTHLLYWHGRDKPAPPRTRRAKYDKTID